VAGTEAAGSVVLTVSDGCGGIAAEHIPRLFEVGWRGDPGRGAAARGREAGNGQVGSGLGLAIVREVVDAHGGSVDVVNVRGGCRFELRLPTAGPAPR
jgi:signal transduction histidine kinase